MKGNNKTMWIKENNIICNVIAYSMRNEYNRRNRNMSDKRAEDKSYGAFTGRKEGSITGSK